MRCASNEYLLVPSKMKDKGHLSDGFCHFRDFVEIHRDDIDGSRLENFSTRPFGKGTPP